MNGKVLRAQKGQYTVEYENGGTLTECVCRSSSKLGKNGTVPLPGDTVEFELNSDGTGFIGGISPRKNTFVRPPISNVDVLAVVIATANPQPATFTVDKLTVSAVAAGVEVCVIINKTDIASPESLCEIYEKCGFRCFPLSALKGTDTEVLKQWLYGKITVFSGVSGVGKSSLINNLYPSLNARVGELSDKIMRGKNTTRHTVLYNVGNGTYIADSPGFSRIEIGSALPYEAVSKQNDFVLTIDAEELQYAFPEFEKHIGTCRWSDCSHTKEDGCAVKNAVENGEIAESRYDSYLKLYYELKSTT